MSNLFSRNRFAGTAAGLFVAVAMSLSLAQPAEAAICKALWTHAEGFHPNKVQALAHAVNAWSTRASAYGLGWNFWASAVSKQVNCNPATGGLIRCKVQAKPCLYSPDPN